MHQPFIHSYQLFMKHLPYAKLSTSFGNQVNKITCMANREGSIINKLRAQRYRPRFTSFSKAVDILTQVPFCAPPNLSRIIELQSPETFSDLASYGFIQSQTAEAEAWAGPWPWGSLLAWWYPPRESLGFMGRSWRSNPPSPDHWGSITFCVRVLCPCVQAHISKPHLPAPHLHTLPNPFINSYELPKWAKKA